MRRAGVGYLYSAGALCSMREAAQEKRYLEEKNIHSTITSLQRGVFVSNTFFFTPDLDLVCALQRIPGRTSVTRIQGEKSEIDQHRWRGVTSP